MTTYLLLALAVGTLLPLQAGINATLRTRLASPLQAALVSFAVGTVVLGAATLFTRAPWRGQRIPGAPWWVWTGGLIGASYVFSAVVLARRLGATQLLAFVVAGQMLSSLVLDHFGIAGFPVHQMSLPRVAGVVLLIAGVALIRVF